MSDEASTSAASSYTEIEKSKLLQQALSEAGAKRAQAQRKRKSQDVLSVNHTELIKAKIRVHPLMPIVKLLLDKLEQACSHMRNSAFKIDDVIQQLTQMEREGVKIRTGDTEVDELMTSAVVSLRTQLAELEKVASLTDNFYVSYTSKLKKRVNQETLVGTGGDSDDEPMGTPTPEDELRRLNPSSLATLTTANGMVTIPLRLPPHPLNLNFLNTPGSTSRSIFPLDVSSSMPMPFAHLPFFSFSQIQSFTRQQSASAATTESSQES